MKKNKLAVSISMVLIVLVCVLLCNRYNICNKLNKSSNVNKSNYIQNKKINKSSNKNLKSNSDSNKNDDNYSDTNIDSDPIKDKINEMNFDEKIGQMVMTGVDGYTIDENTTKMIKDYHVGGFIIMGRNIKDANQLLNLVNSLKNTNLNNKVPLFISIDQEGGRVDRMYPQFKRLPSSKIMGIKDDSDLSYELGKIISEELNLFGINMDFAPVLDINNNPNNTVIGDRSFGSDPRIVAKLGIETMNGIRKGNIISIVKHFPGHGDTSVDSHIGLPLVNKNLEVLKDFELLPFEKAVSSNVDGVMVAHILFPKIDDKNPASMSSNIINDILRENLKFDGVVITDDMTMGAIIENYNIGDAAVKAVNAGSNIILVCHGYDNQILVINALKKAVQDGVISEETINQSVYRILKLKNKYRIDNKSNRAIKSTSINNINNRINDILK